MTTTFKPPPTDGLDHCNNNNCPPGNTCFIYSGGFLCQPFTPPPSYPATGPSAIIVEPPQWYLADNYPSISYTGDLTNQTQGANCTTIPIPKNRLYFDLITSISNYDLGPFYTTALDQEFSSTLVQYRGNCAEDFYCLPNQPVNATLTDYQSALSSVQGSLLGTCQKVQSPNQPCQSSVMCAGWHIQPNGTWNNDQFRCGPPTNPPPANWNTNPVGGTCQDQHAGTSTDSSTLMQRSARMYLLASLFLFFLLFLYLWYRRMKMRQRQEAIRMVYTVRPNDNTAIYTTRGGVNRAPDENDNGELPAYGNHRRDERVTGPAAEEIGMYSFQTSEPFAPPPLSSPPPAGAYPPSATTARPVQHNYPFPMSHPSLTNNVFSTTPTGNPLYPPPASSPPPLHQTAAEAQAVAIAAAAAAAIATPRPAAANLQAGGLLPPSYDATTPEGAKINTTEKERNPFETDDTGTLESSSSSPTSSPHPRYGDKDTKERLPASSASSTHGSGSGSSDSGVPPPSSKEPKNQ